MSVDWSYYDKYERINDMYLPSQGEGDSLATQIVTAVTKLVYKWYNDGDVFDNTGWLAGWLNDLSSYANWLNKYTDSNYILSRIRFCHSNSDYEDLLKDLTDHLFDDEDLENASMKPKQGSIYECEGPFKFNEYDEDEDEDDYYDEYEDY